MANAAENSPSSPAPSTRICVFASTLLGNSPANTDAARALAHVFHDRGIHLIYGGGTSGLMGELARERVRLGGPDSVTGIIPGALVLPERGAKRGNTELTPVHVAVRRKKDSKGEVVMDDSYDALLSSTKFGAVKVMPSLAARKAYMMELVAKGGPGSGFIALPGGFGTFDEVGEVLAAKQMGVHNCKMVLFNVEGFWDGILQWVETGILKGIVRDEAKEMLVSKETAEECVQALAHDESVGNILDAAEAIANSGGSDSEMVNNDETDILDSEPYASKLAPSFPQPCLNYTQSGDNPLRRHDPKHHLSLARTVSYHSIEGFVKEDVETLVSPGGRYTHKDPEYAQLNGKPSGIDMQHHMQDQIHNIHPAYRKSYVCIDISPNKDFLSGCRKSARRKEYRSDYNAVGHLRRAHFGKEYRARQAIGIAISLDELRGWLQEEIEFTPGSLFNFEVTSRDPSRVFSRSLPNGSLSLGMKRSREAREASSNSSLDHDSLQFGGATKARRMSQGK